MTSQVLAGIQVNFDGNLRVRAFGWYTAVLSGSAVLGQIAGGTLVAGNLFDMSWRPVFMVNIPICIFLLWVTAMFMPGAQRRTALGLDIGCILILSIAMILLILPLTMGQDLGWPSWGWVCMATSVPAFVMFTSRELRLMKEGLQPLINLRLLGRQAVGWGILSQALSTSTYYATLFDLALYLQQGLGKTPTYSGLALVSWVTAFGVVGPLLGRIPKRHVPLAAPVGAWILSLSFFGVGITLLGGSASGPGLFTEAADMSGLFNTVLRISAVIGVAVFGTAYLRLVGPLHGPGVIHGFAVINFALSGTALLAALFAHVSIRDSVKTYS